MRLDGLRPRETCINIGDDYYRLMNGEVCDSVRAPIKFFRQ